MSQDAAGWELPAADAGAAAAGALTDQAGECETQGEAAWQLTLEILGLPLEPPCSEIPLERPQPRMLKAPEPAAPDGLSEVANSLAGESSPQCFDPLLQRKKARAKQRPHKPAKKARRQKRRAAKVNVKKPAGFRRSKGKGRRARRKALEAEAAAVPPPVRRRPGAEAEPPAAAAACAPLGSGGSLGRAVTRCASGAPGHCSASSGAPPQRPAAAA